MDKQIKMLTCFLYITIVYPIVVAQSDSINNLEGVSLILVDGKYNRIYFSGINAFYSLPLQTNEVTTHEFKPKPSDLKECRNKVKQDVEFKCQNHIKVLQYDLDGNVFVCGTSASSPRCVTYKRTSDGIEFLKTSSGYYISPDNYKDNSNILFTDPYLFVASSRFGKAAIRKVDNKKDFNSAIQTKDSPSVFNSPTFISSHMIDDSNYAYFFFTEIGVQDNKRKVIYSRIGRICKFDNADFVGSRKFSSFLKSQLVCYEKGDPLNRYFDELQATYIIDVHDSKSSEKEKFLYAIFTSSLWEGSAICRYKVKDIVEVFEKKSMSVYTFVTETKSWKVSPFTDKRKQYTRRTCDQPYKVNPDPELSDIRKFPLLYDDIQPHDGEAIIAKKGVSFTSLYVDDVHLFEDSSDIGMDVMFAGTSNGKIMKIAINSTGPFVPTVPETLIVQSAQPIKSIVKIKDNLYAAAGAELAIFNTENECNKKVSCKSCVGAKDPYCGWDESIKKCTAIGNIEQQNRLMDLYTGDVSICPKQKKEFKCDIKLLQASLHSKAQLECTSSAKETEEKPKIISWRYENKPITPSHTEGYSITGTDTWVQRLEIKNFTEANSGVYHCVIELDGEQDKCSYDLKVPDRAVNISRTVNVTTTPTTTTTTATILLPISVITHASTTISKASDNVIVINTTPAAPAIGKNDTSYFQLFIIFLILFILVLMLFLCCCCCVVLTRRTQNETEIDGLKNGHVNSMRNVLWLQFTKKYKFKRNDSASKDLIKKKNRNLVYKDTTVEMHDANGGDKSATVLENC